MDKPEATFHPTLYRLAQALNGDLDTLRWAASQPDLIDTIHFNRLGPALANRATESGIQGPAIDAWRDLLHANAAHRLLLQHELGRVSQTLGDAGVQWTPIKGMGFDTNVYPRPEERPSTDIDVLIDPSDLDHAIEELENTGWKSAYTTPRQQHYFRNEGYNWAATSTAGTLLELHFLLWGSVARPMAGDVLERAAPDSPMGPTARRVALPDAFVIAASHVWITPTPRYLFLWWDLQRIAEAATDKEIQQILAISRSEDLQVFVHLAARGAADLWGHPGIEWLADQLAEDLKLPERRVLSRLRRTPQTHIPLGALAGARILSGRTTRGGVRSAYRRVWAHPGIVELNTPDDWPWPKRRTAHLLRSLRLTKP